MNLIIRLLLELGILKPKEGSWSDIKYQEKQKKLSDKKVSEKERFETADYSHDPIQGPRRYVEQSDWGVDWKLVIPVFLVGFTVMGLLVWASNEWVLSDDTPEKRLRAEWIEKTRTMSCIDLKKIVDQCYWKEKSGCDTPSVGVAFSYWEYQGLEKLYPSPRPDDECIKETGYILEEVIKCDGRTGFFGCQEYLYPRDESTMTITFPSDWHYTDPFTSQDYTNPNEFLKEYHPELSEWNGVIGDS